MLKVEVPFDIFGFGWGPDEAAAVAPLFGDVLGGLILRRVEAWRPHQGKLKRMPWFQEEDCSRSTIVGLRQGGTLRGARDPETGAWLGEADDLFRMQIRRIIRSAMPSANRPIGRRSTAGLKHQKPKRPKRVPTPQEQAALDRANERRRQQKLDRLAEKEAPQ
jgi:hypothetical protein